VKTPHFFMSYMSGERANLVRNDAACTCTNSVHAVVFHEPQNAVPISRAWSHPFVQLSCELEGHPLGGGMLKLEPSEAGNIAIPPAVVLRNVSKVAVSEAVCKMRAWRHHDRDSQAVQ